MEKNPEHSGVGALLEEVEHLSTQELEDFVSKVLNIRAERIAPVLSDREAYLMEIINVGLSEAQQIEWDKLVEKRQDETITPEELQALIRLTEEAERLNVERMKGLAELAQLRKTSLKGIMQELEIFPV